MRRAHARLATATLLASSGAALSAGCAHEPAPSAPTTTHAAGRASDAGPAAPAPERPEGTPWFVECAAASGLDFTHDSGHRQRYLMPESACGGAALFDMDGDGDLDAYLVQAGPLDGPESERPPNRLFRNDGDGTFQDVTSGSGADDRGYGMGVATGDYDNDGDVDLYVTNVGPNVLLANDGRGTFRDVTEDSGTGHAGFGSAAAFLDYDGDGDLDLFVGNYLNWTPEGELDCRNDAGEPDYCAPAAYAAPARDVLFRNEGDGTFADVTESAGLATAFGTTLGVVCGDLGGDGLIDIFVANDGLPDLLWINRGGGRFEEQGTIAGCAIDQDGRAKAGMGVSAADVDDDGDEDLLVVNLVRESDSFFRNEGGYFVDDTALVGLAAPSRPFTRFGLGLIDFDQDGRLDVFQAAGRVARGSPRHGDDPYAEPNVLLRGIAGGRFEPVVPTGGTADALVATSRAAAFGDVDGDGDVDVLVVNRDGPAHLLRNLAGDGQGWIGFRVVDEHRRDALGAVVELDIPGRRVRRTVRTAYSYLAANEPRVHVGLGGFTHVTDVTVRWPDGALERFGDHDAGRVVRLRRGKGVPASGVVSQPVER